MSDGEYDDLTPKDPKTRESWLRDEAEYRAFYERIGKRTHDPLFLRGVLRDGEMIVLGRCPGCGEWGELDDDQFHGRVSTHHDEAEGGCGYHDTVDWFERYTAPWATP